MSETEPEYDRDKDVLRLYARRPRREREQSITLPESSEVSRQIVRNTAKDMRMSEAFANFLLNRSLSKFRLLKQKVAGVIIDYDALGDQKNRGSRRE